MRWIWVFTQFPYCCYMLHKFRERSFIGSHSLTLRHKIKNKYINFWGTQVNFVDPNKWRKFHNFSCHINLNMLLDYYKLDWLKVADISNMYFLQFTDAVAIYATVWYGYSHCTRQSFSTVLCKDTWRWNVSELRCKKHPWIFWCVRQQNYIILVNYCM